MSDGCLWPFAPTIFGAGSESKTATVGDVRSLVEKMKEDIVGEIRKEMQEMTQTIRESNNKVQATMVRLSSEVRSLQQDVDQVAAQTQKGQFARALACLTSPICGGQEKKAVRDKRLVSVDSLAEQALDEPVSAAPASSLKQVPASGSSSGARQPCVLSPVVDLFSISSRLLSEAKEIERGPFVDGLGEYAKLLDRLGGNMGSYLESNLQKLRRSKADAQKSGYREWLLTELPVHKQTKYKEYVDDSAWMANLWIGWTMEFFVELFAELHSGKQTKAAADAAYSRTLYNHHNYFQRQAFTFAVARLPERGELFGKLRGGASEEELVHVMGEFVAVGRPLAAFCCATNDELCTRMQAAAKSGR